MGKGIDSRVEGLSMVEVPTCSVVRSASLGFLQRGSMHWESP